MLLSRSKLSCGITLGVLLVGVFGGLVSPSGASEAHAGEPGKDKVIHYRPSSAEIAQTASYWTPARMQQAQSGSFVDPDPDGGDPPRVASALPATDDRLTTRHETKRIVPRTDPTKPTPGFKPSDHLGVVFFRSSGRDQRCTGNVIVSDSGNLVATAGRCVSALKDQFVDRLAFVPAYNGTAPHGVWPAVIVTARTGWTHQRLVDDDSAFFQTAIALGQKAPLSETVGASGVSFKGQEDDDEFRATGYSLDAGSNPNVPISVTSTAEPNPWMNTDYAIEGLEWDARTGVSGAPWVSTDSDPVVDVQRGMTTFAYQRFVHASFGPQWTAAIEDEYRAAAIAKG